VGIGALVGQQVTKLAQNLPVYQYNIEEKIPSARGFAGGAMPDLKLSRRPQRGGPKEERHPA
jgi:hypothetical protein